MPLDTIQALRFGYDTERAWLTELAFGFNLWDMFSRWSDRCEWYAISLVVNDGSEILFYVAGQVEKREPLLGWWFRGVNAVLQRLGVRDDVAEHSRAVLDEVLELFASAGRRLHLA